MSNIVPQQEDERAKAIEALVLQGDLSKLTSEQKVYHYNSVCESVGLNPKTQPFGYQKFQGREILYAKKDAADQLRKIHGISVKVLEKTMDGDLYTVTAAASARDGRYDEDIGAVNIKGLAGEALANAKMKAMTKAKRRVTLSICGLGFLDETEVQDMQNSMRDVRAKELTAAVQETEERPEFETYVDDSLENYIFPDIKIGGKSSGSAGKRLHEIDKKKLESFVTWAQSQENLDAEALVCFEHVTEYLAAQ